MFLHVFNCIYKTTKKDNYNRAARWSSNRVKRLFVAFLCIKKEKKSKKTTNNLSLFIKFQPNRIFPTASKIQFGLRQTP